MREKRSSVSGALTLCSFERRLAWTMPSESRHGMTVLLLGAALGLAAGDVLLGLNPHLLGPLATSRLVGGCAIAGVVIAAPAALLVRRRRTLRRLLVALALAGALLFVAAESQRRIWYAFLPNGARRVFVVTCLAAAVTATAAVLALVHDRDEPWPIAIAFVSFLLVPAAGRRLREHEALAVPPSLARTPTRSVVVIGLEGASWSYLTSEASSGTLPNIARLLGEGAAGPLRSLEPYDRAALYTTAATGKLPRKHGVVSSVTHRGWLGEIRLLPRLPWGPLADAVSLPPRGAPLEARRSLALWEILASRGHGATVLNWPSSFPARDGTVLWATEAFFDGASDADAARPREAAASARLFRVDVTHLDRPLVRALVPRGLDDADRRRAAPLEGAARDLTVVGAALGAVPTGPGSVSAVVLTGLASVARVFGPAVEPSRYFGVATAHADERALALRAYYRFLDDLVGDLVAREGESRTVCVFAPVGYGPPPGLAAALDFVAGREPHASPEGARDGFVLLAGPGIRRGARLTSASLVDLTPTLLALAGEPIARDMDGRVLAEAFDARYAEEATIPVVTTFEPGGAQ